MQLPTQDTPNPLISNCSWTGTVSFSHDFRVPSTDRHEGNDLGRKSSERIECVARTIPRNVRDGLERKKLEILGWMWTKISLWWRFDCWQIESWHSSRYEDGIKVILTAMPLNWRDRGKRMPWKRNPQEYARITEDSAPGQPTGQIGILATRLLLILFSSSYR